MAELKTKPNLQSVDNFLKAVMDERRRRDCYVVLELMKKVTGEEPKMWKGLDCGFWDLSLQVREWTRGGYACY